MRRPTCSIFNQGGVARRPHRRTSQGVGGAAPRLGQNRYFSGRSQSISSQKWKLFVFIKWKQNGVHFIERDSAQNPGFLLMIIGWGESGKVILQVSTQHSSSFWHCRDTFRAKTAQRTQRKLAGTPDEAWLVFNKPRITKQISVSWL